jgi:predicted amidohydrolase
MGLQVVVGQLEADWDPVRNSERVVSFLRAETRPGCLAVLPEAVLSGYDDQLSGLDRLDERALAAGRTAVAAAARDLGVHVLCGSLLPESGSFSNAAMYFGPAGERWTYRKVNLATHERGLLAAGHSLPLLRLKDARPPQDAPSAGGRPAAERPPVDIGVQLCRELRYPEQWHVLARRGALLLAYLTYAANPQIAAGVWRSHLISRAAETQRFVLAANVASRNQHCPSMVISPRGEVVAETTTTGPQALHADLDLAEVSDLVLSQQRCDVVGISYYGSDLAAGG